jgi:hypothetical protein
MKNKRNKGNMKKRRRKKTQQQKQTNKETSLNNDI